MPETGEKTVVESYQDITRDPREEEDWFRRLPAEAQDELREAWSAKRVRHLPWVHRNRRMYGRCVLEGVVVLAVPSVMVGGFSLALFALPIGALLGALWAGLHSGRIQSAMSAMGGMTVLVTISGFWASRYDAVAFFFSVFAVFVAGLLGAVLGFSRELDRREQAL